MKEIKCTENFIGTNKEKTNLLINFMFNKYIGL